MQRACAFYEYGDTDSESVVIPPGALDDVRILRYAHVYRDRHSGGVEQHLRLLNQGLLLRHRLTILQMYLSRDATDFTIDTEYVGKGRILWVPVPILHSESKMSAIVERIRYIDQLTLATCQLGARGWLRSRLASLRSLLRHRAGHLRFKTMVFSEVLDHLVVTERIDLVSLHWLSYDTGDLIRRAASAQIPIVVINHFENSRLSLRQSRKWLTHAAAVGTVSGQDIPGDLTHRTCNLSDAVNTDFFDPQRAKPTLPVGRPVIFLPARIQTGKGHHDLIQAARILNARNLNFSLCFTGAVDSQSLHEELDGCDATCGLEGQILFLGEISAVDIRDWYARSSVVVLPSRSEGLPRVLLEAQAMKKPVVAYDCGGIREAMVPDKTGFLVKAGDLEDLASKIAFLLENEPQRLRMGECGREFVTQQFSVSALIQRHEAFYVNALSNARAGHRSLTGR